MNYEQSSYRHSGRLVVAGVAGGVGTTVVALSLSGGDARVFTGRDADILVCRTTAESLLRASRVAGLLGKRLGAVAVNALDGSRPARPIAARIRLLESATATVMIPFVPALLSAPDPHSVLRSALRTPDADLSKPLRRFLSAVRELAAAAGDRPAIPVAPSRPAPAQPAKRGLAR